MAKAVEWFHEHMKNTYSYEKDADALLGDINGQIKDIAAGWVSDLRWMFMAESPRTKDYKAHQILGLDIMLKVTKNEQGKFQIKCVPAELNYKPGLGYTNGLSLTKDDKEKIERTVETMSYHQNNVIIKLALGLNWRHKLEQEFYGESQKRNRTSIECKVTEWYKNILKHTPNTTTRLAILDEKKRFRKFAKTLNPEIMNKIVDLVQTTEY